MLKIVVAGAALAVLAASASAQAAQSSAAIGPKQPVPYAKLDAYLKASPRARANTDWWSGSSMASTGMSSDTSATMSATSATTPNARPTPSADGSGNSVNDAMGASQFQGAASTTTTGATPAQPAPKSHEVHN